MKIYRIGYTFSEIVEVDAIKKTDKTVTSQKYGRENTQSQYRAYADTREQAVSVLKEYYGSKVDAAQRSLDFAIIKYKEVCAKFNS